MLLLSYKWTHIQCCSVNCRDIIVLGFSARVRPPRMASQSQKSQHFDEKLYADLHFIESRPNAAASELSHALPDTIPGTRFYFNYEFMEKL